MKIAKKTLIIILTASSFANAAQIQKQFISTEEARRWATSADAGEQKKFTGFVMGIHDAFNQLFFCTKSSVSAREVEEVSRRFLVERSDLDHKSGADVVRQALKEAYACGKR
ncbi:MAG: Rap1a/Tai family immunity protein [Betaproteobacteria bacterium]